MAPLDPRARGRREGGATDFRKSVYGFHKLTMDDPAIRFIDDLGVNPSIMDDPRKLHRNCASVSVPRNATTASISWSSSAGFPPRRRLYGAFSTLTLSRYLAGMSSNVPDLYQR